ncbi:MAG TPA: single-stranded-DNA-specific exonuclease RecJ [Burkholderiales bacterium]|nr:single-stranded-DNA-specific exonuclease RecJ [Burkholderiales bacterium]
MTEPLILKRAVPAEAARVLCDAGIPPLLARVYAARGVSGMEQLSDEFERLHRPESMLNMKRMAQLLADAIAARRRLLIVADYDADGATACAVGLRALRAMGADVFYIVPNRFEYGYGLTPEIVQLAHRTHHPDVIITVDNGIASVDGVAEANRLGMQVLVTDHHLPGDTLPDAWCIVNPNQPGCQFASKNLAGVGVMFYLMLALRAELKDRRALEDNGPNLAVLLDLVALGTVADVVQLDDNNRRLVQQGLKRMRAGRYQPGVAALFRAAARDIARASTYDLGFALGPRLNAAGRLTDMTLGIECLTTDDVLRADQIARELDALNRERRNIEADMQEAALASIESTSCGDEYTLSLFDPAWHQGVIGIVASRIKDRYHRPTIAFARGSAGEIKGSARSIAGLHMRDALDLVTKRHPGLILKFGGHAAAAGLTLRESDFERFCTAFEDTVRSLVSASDLERQIETDGSLSLEEATLEAAAALAMQPWGSGFPEPRFHDTFDVASQRVVGGRHLRLKLLRDARPFDAILFGAVDELPPRIAAVYRLEVNEYRSERTLQLTLHHWRSAV